jgi:hypothetical protein
MHKLAGYRIYLQAFISLAVLLAIGGQQLVSAQGGASDNYRIDESFIGPGGNLESESDAYKLEAGQSSLGNPGGAGEAGSDNFTIQSGATTTADPRLSCSITSGALNFGSLSSGATTTATATFNVLNYTSYGYNVSLLGGSLSNGSHTLAPMSTTGPSEVGTEQFGINLKANTNPTVGAEPVQVPSSSFSFGSPTANYGTANNFRFVPGETIAAAAKSSGQTDYTVSYIVNAANTTPGGRYTGNQTILCTGTY